MKDISHGSWFMGPKAENHESWEQFIVYILRDHIHWRRNYYPSDSVVVNRAHIRENEEWIDNLNGELDKILAAFKSNNPIYSPRYLAHMVSEQSLPSILGYFAGMLYNSNNVSGESSPVGVPMELEVGRMVSEMLGFDPQSCWSHITSGGTVANIESLWVARTVKFVPFMAREFCVANDIEFHIKTPNCEMVDIRNCPDRTMLGLCSHEAIHIIRDITRHLVEKCGWEIGVAASKIADSLKNSDFNVIRVGLHKILSRLGVEPVIFVSPSAHYSIKKAANVLGYGECAVRTIDVDTQFRMRVDKLQEAVENLADNEFIAAVISISGTTEEGAIDPLHKIVELRNSLELTHNRSFWLHVDSAWGGYLRSLFCGYEVNNRDKADEYIAAINSPMVNSTDEKLWEKHPEIYLSLMSYPEADSITIDPHKLGYTPYPAGIVSFKDSIVTEHIKQEAPYIFYGEQQIQYDEVPHITEIGSYILEGSKPGAAAASCYLAHKTIPLTLEGHGKIIKATLQSTIKLQNLMERHFASFDEYSIKATEKMQAEGTMLSGRKFTTIPLHTADSNLICFVVLPVVPTSHGLNVGWEIDGSLSLIEANALNERIYHRMAIDNNHKLGSTTIHDYFVSKTHFVDNVYSYESLRPTLEKIGVTQSEYEEHGLFVMRTTIMNPYYPIAEQGGTDYLDGYITCIHANTEATINKK